MLRPPCCPPRAASGGYQVAGTRVTQACRKLTAMDVWEHAYYLDYLNERRRYLEGVADKLLNWEFAEANFIKSPQPPRYSP
ncbi:MAG: Fe-Mn family superoxide dismutase [Candidatus Portnoybacteria bacterium]|nr:Fe-Mn family superoxide dismutase [Candidatus Portnoybacteria bacterium]MDD5657068.1 Fe-Mn family superoxide dismutase [Elusimicrobiota bacterium]